MKKTALSLVLCVVVFLGACQKKDATPPSGSDNGSGAPTPSFLQGKWLHGNFAMASYWAYDGSYQGNPFEQSVAFNFLPDSRYEFFYIGRTKDYNGCATDGLSYFKGTIKFNTAENSFEVHPTEGHFKGFYTCASNRNFDRSAKPNELNVSTFYYSLEENNGVQYVRISQTKNDQYASYFKSTTW